jgi:hypothetical protein
LFGYGSKPGADRAASNSTTVTGSDTVVTMTDGASIVFIGTPTLKSFKFS